MLGEQPSIPKYQVRPYLNFSLPKFPSLIDLLGKKVPKEEEPEDDVSLGIDPFEESDIETDDYNPLSRKGFSGKKTP